MTYCMHVLTINEPPLCIKRQAYIGVMQSHPLRRMRLSKHKGLPAVLGWPGVYFMHKIQINCIPMTSVFCNRKAQQVAAKWKLHQSLIKLIAYFDIWRLHLQSVHNCGLQFHCWGSPPVWSQYPCRQHCPEGWVQFLDQTVQMKQPLLLWEKSHKWTSWIIIKIIHYLQTCWWQSELSAGHICISSPPEVITHSAPLIVVTDLNSTFTGVWPTLKSDVTIGTQCQIWRNIKTSFIVKLLWFDTLWWTIKERDEWEILLLDPEYLANHSILVIQV